MTAAPGPAVPSAAAPSPAALSHSARPEQLIGRTLHARRGAIARRFSYRVDYLILDPEAPATGPWPLRRNRAGIIALHDADHGGPPGQGRGADWVRGVLAGHGMTAATGRLLLVAQPRVLGHAFNPVSFWLCHDGTGGLRAVIAEVTNTFGDRHSYLLARPDHAPITEQDKLTAGKALHVSPFQPVAGGYAFRFDIRPDRIAITIDYREDGGGLFATLTGARRPATTRGLIGAALRRPLGSRRVLALIHWQALLLWWRGARYRRRPDPPGHEVSR